MRNLLTTGLVAICAVWAWPASATNALLEIQESHWLEAMRISRVDSELLYAISLQESGTSFNGMRQYGPWPWTMNIKEEGRYYSSREAARRALAHEVEAGNRSIAVGMWQIYLYYNGHFVEDPLDLLDPVTNLMVAAKVLRKCGDKYETTRHVLSCYHSGDLDDEGLAYADRVLRLARKWGEPYRLRFRPEEVVFTHHRPDAPTIERGRRVVSIDGRAEPSWNDGLSIATLALATDTTTPSHGEFMETLNTTDDQPVRRVIIVE